MTQSGGGPTKSSICLVIQGQEKKVTGSHTEGRSRLPGKIQSKLASAGRFLPLVSRRRLVLTAALFICVIGEGCSGFFINPTISSIYITPSAATIAVNGTATLTAHANYSDGSQGEITGDSVGWTSSATSIA